MAAIDAEQDFQWCFGQDLPDNGSHWSALLLAKFLLCRCSILAKFMSYWSASCVSGGYAQQEAAFRVTQGGCFFAHTDADEADKVFGISKDVFMQDILTADPGNTICISCKSAQPEAAFRDMQGNNPCRVDMAHIDVDETDKVFKRTS